jgi:hypothetical protein
MYIPSYQMQNVIKVYSKQLKQAMVSKEKCKMPEKRQSNRMNLSSEEKRQAAIKKVSKGILDKISSFGFPSESGQRNAEYVNINPNSGALPHQTENNTFVFNAIDSINQKSTNTLSVDDSRFLIQRLDQLAKKQAKKRNPESDNRRIDSAVGAMDR